MYQFLRMIADRTVGSAKTNVFFSNCLYQLSHATSIRSHSTDNDRGVPNHRCVGCLKNLNVTPHQLCMPDYTVVVVGTWKEEKENYGREIKRIKVGILPSSGADDLI